LILGHFSGELTGTQLFKVRVRGGYIEGGFDVSDRKAAIAGPRAARFTAPVRLVVAKLATIAYSTSTLVRHMVEVDGSKAVISVSSA
jgi:hypothetical protein